MTKTFRDLGVEPALCDALADGGITHPFPIQELTLPLALDGHDLIGQARTGTGKTLAFGIPLLQRLDPSLGHTQALVIVPTRELCLQVYSDLQVGAAKKLTSISVYGGVGYDEQIEALGAGAHVVVGTPGRLLDLLNRGVLDLSKVTQLVLDEADEMLDMGFLPDVERLVEACTGEDRHTMLFSATMPTAIVKLARRYMDHPTFTRADHEQKNTAPLVTQYFFQVHRMDKPRLLARILQARDRGGVYVFVRTKHMADRLVNDLEELRVPSIAIHGDLRQSTREKNLDRFRSGKATVLVCTEVAARGLDVSGVTHVVNYDCPDDEKMYLHRIGRTARAGEAGVAITFAEFNEIDRLNVIRKAVGATDREVEQVFSTSKQLKEWFDLPDERPWDHLSGKGDERPAADGPGGSNGRGDRSAAGGRRPSRGRSGQSDGRPKSRRTSEGRGGEHDARRSRAADRATRDRGPDATTVDEGSSSGQRRSAQAASTHGASGQGASRQEGSDAPRRRARDSSDAQDRAPRGRTEDDATSAPADARAPRTRTRTRARTTAGSDTGRDHTNRTERRDDSGADTDRAGSDTPVGDRADAGAVDNAPRARQRARGNRRQRGSSANADERPGRNARDTAGSSGGRASTSSPDTDTKGPKTTSDDGGGSASRTDRGRERRPSRAGAPSGGRQANRRDGTQQDTDRARDGQAGRRGGRGSGKQGGNDGRNRGTSGRNTGNGSSRGRGRRGGSGGGRGGASDGHPAVAVAARGADARGDGQPQPVRRVKVEHLP